MAISNQGDGTEIVAALNEENVEAAAALAYIAEVFESDPEAALAKTLGHWSQWLGDEGYTADSVEQVIRQVVAAELDAINQSALLDVMSADITVREAVNCINGQAPSLIAALLRHVDHGAALHAAVLGISGGTGRRAPLTGLGGNNKPGESRLEKVQTHLRKELGAVLETKSVVSRDQSRTDGLQAPEKALRKELGNVRGQDNVATSKGVQTLRQVFDNAAVGTFRNARKEQPDGQSDAKAEFKETQAG